MIRGPGGKAPPAAAGKPNILLGTEPWCCREEIPPAVNPMPTFDVDDCVDFLKQAKQAGRRMLKDCHPDKQAHKTPQQRLTADEATELTKTINSARAHLEEWASARFPSVFRV